MSLRLPHERSHCWEMDSKYSYFLDHNLDIDWTLQRWSNGISRKQKQQNKQQQNSCMCYCYLSINWIVASFDSLCAFQEFFENWQSCFFAHFFSHADRFRNHSLSTVEILLWVSKSSNRWITIFPLGVYSILYVLKVFYLDFIKRRACRHLNNLKTRVYLFWVSFLNSFRKVNQKVEVWMKKCVGKILK